MFLYIVNSLAPVFLVIALGWTLWHQAFLPATALHDISRLTYWVGLPCWLFYKTAGANLAFEEAGDLFVVTTGSTLFGIGLSYCLAKAIGIPGSSIGTFVQASFRGNLAFIGLPVVYYAFSTGGDSAASAEATALLVFGPMVVLYNVAAVLALVLSHEKTNGQTLGKLGKLGKELASNPLLIACLAGGFYSLMGWSLPTLLERSLAAVGQMALPLALLCIGGSLVRVKVTGNLSWAVSAAVTKVVLMPLLGYAMAWLVGLGPESLRIALILLACPTASVSYVLVNQLGGNEALASGAIVVSSLLAALSLTVVLAVT